MYNKNIKITLETGRMGFLSSVSVDKEIENWLEVKGFQDKSCWIMSDLMTVWWKSQWAKNRNMVTAVLTLVLG